MKESDAMLNQSKQDSPEAAMFFGAKQQRDTNTQTNMSNIDVKFCISTQIHMLRNAYLTFDGWKHAVDDFNNTKLCTPHDVFNIRLKSKYLSVALTKALSKYKLSTFLNICKSAIDVIDEVDYDGCDTRGNGRIKNPQTIMQ